ncbi:hypothetical protein [Methanosarcina sp. 2.H.A.1B.4]|uniref:hypothetical protein n=1 Tax=Methanosarcina sp. 2.H.A.1B.4 TaxID=1483600 RepID=UPI00062158DA|nr:hypothetical protein [Methanosarcina sp. 2.H.A.1B.4]KKG08762.1 hypothetical protein EO92_13115 [Methanosarcina sp. 2.H.A.1B.4]
MIDREYIKKNINLIFDVETLNIRNNKLFHYVETSSDVNTEKKGSSGAYTPRYSARPPFVDMQLNPNGNWELQWETYTNLKKLYNKVEHLPGCRKVFLDILEKKLSNLGAISVSTHIDSRTKIPIAHELHSSASLAFYFLLKIDCKNAIIGALEKKLNENMIQDTVEDINTGEYVDIEIYNCENDIEGLFRSVLRFMHLEPICFSEQLLNFLNRTAYNCLGTSSDLGKQFIEEIIFLNYNRLIDELKDSNEEINIHKEQVIELISRYGFPQDMERFLLEIDELPDLSKWQSVNSGMIGNLRSFFEALVRSIADKISTKTGVECPKPQGNETEIGIKRKYIKEQLELSGADNKLIDSFVTILHKEGGHTFVSERKYFVMTKNIGIEIAYFLLSIYEEKFEKS